MDNKIYSGYACFSFKVEVAPYPSTHKHEILVLESNPEPGYFSRGDFPQNLVKASDHHLYLLVKKPVSCFQEIVMKHSYYVKNKLNLNLHISPGQMTFQNKVYPCIRIRTTELEQLQPFIEDVKNLEIEFLHHKLFHKIEPYISFIQYKKFIEYEPIDEGIYRDVNDNNRHFVAIPGEIEFDAFEKIIETIKNNCDFNMFNSSLVYLPQKDNVAHFAAIYSKHCDEKRLPEFRDFIKKEIEEHIAG